MVATHRLTIEQVKGDQDWSALEQDLLDECALGRLAFLPGKDYRPRDQSDPDRRLRPRLIRYLLEGGCDNGWRPSPKGVRVQGAWIEGELDLRDCVSPLDLDLKNCLFQNPLSCRDASLGALFLTGSRAEQGVDLHRLKTTKSVMLCDGFHATGLVDLAGADIGGQLTCTGGRFDGGKGVALQMGAAMVGASVNLRDGFHATGLVNLIGADIGGQLACIGGRFEGGLDLDTVRCRRALFLGNMSGNARSGPVQRGQEAAFWKGLPETIPYIDLNSAHCAVLVDNAAVWANFAGIRLRNFRYDSVYELGRVNDRLDWLARASAKGAKFDPQPYTHLARIMDGEGLRRSASVIRVAREDRLRDAEWARRADLVAASNWPVFTWIGALVRLCWLYLFRALFGYGHQPARVFITIGLIWGFAAWLYGAAYGAGQMAPNSDVVLTSSAWLEAVRSYGACAADCALPLQRWLQTPDAQDYETFNRWIYGLDLFVPLDALGQENAWAPSKVRGDLGWWGYYARMPIQMAGWIITAVGAAVVTGLVGRKD